MNYFTEKRFLFNLNRLHTIKLNFILNSIFSFHSQDPYIYPNEASLTPYLDLLFSIEFFMTGTPSLPAAGRLER